MEILNIPEVEHQTKKKKTPKETFGLIWQVEHIIQNPIIMVVKKIKELGEKAKAYQIIN